MFDVVLPFWISIAVLSVSQGLAVALAGTLRIQRLTPLAGRLWALIPPLSVLAFVFVARAAEAASAQGLTYLALVAVPLLAALALGWLAHGARPLRAILVLLLFALAWADRGGLVGEGAALLLSGLSCVALGTLLAAVTPARWLAGGIVAMALADTALVVSDLLQRPNNALNAAHPAAGLPRLQSAVFGSAVMGYGGLFIAGAPMRLRRRFGDVAPRLGDQLLAPAVVHRPQQTDQRGGRSHQDLLLNPVFDQGRVLGQRGLVDAVGS